MHQSIKELVKVKLTNNQLQALESFINDRGLEIFKNSTLLKLINRNEFDQVPAELRKWVVNNGRKLSELVEMREKEVALFIK
jgi:lysozyme